MKALPVSNRPDKSAPDPADRTPSGPAPPPDPGRATIGDFELRREIGRGGMGTVYEAWQHSLQRRVALKILSGQVSASSTAVVRFQREAQAAAKLHHAHIIPIYAQGEEEGVYYYAMELVDGVGLNTIIAQARGSAGRDPPHFAGTDAANVADTVPLDRTPERQDRPQEADRAEEPKAGDDDTDSAVTLGPSADIRSSTEQFRRVAEQLACVADGLDDAHKHGVIHRDIKPHNLIMGKDGRLRIGDFGLARLSEQPGVTITGELLGSPLYMSPEQIVEGPSNVDARTDVYSLGATMYEWLTRTPPFPGETRERVISLILNAEPRSLRSFNPTIPVELETICFKALERDRDRRYQTAGELRDDLRRFLLNVPIKARRAGPVFRARKMMARHPVVTLAAVAVAVAAVLAWALVSTRSEVKMQTAVAEQAIEKTDQILDLLSSVLPPEIGGLVPFAEAALPVFQDFVATGQRVVGAPGAGESGGASAALARTPAGIARRVAAEFLRAVRPAGSTQQADRQRDGFATLLFEAADLADNDPEGALKRVERCLALRAGDFQARQLQTSLLGRLLRFDKMAEAAEQLVTLRPRDSTAYVWLGLARLFLDQREPSLESLTHAMQLDTESVWAAVLHGLALVGAGRAGESLHDFDRVLAGSPELVVAMLGRAAAHAAAGDLRSAVHDVTRVIELEPDNADALALRGEYHMEHGDYAAALADFERTMALAGRTPAMVFRYLLALSQQREVAQITNGEATSPADTGTNAEREPSESRRAPSGEPTSLLRGGD